MVSPRLEQTMTALKTPSPPSSGYFMPRYRSWSMSFEEAGGATELCLLDWTDANRDEGVMTLISPVEATVNFVLDRGTANKSNDEQVPNKNYCAPSTPGTKGGSRSKRSRAVLGRMRRLLSQPRSASGSARMMEFASYSVPTVDNMPMSRRLFHVDDGGAQARSRPRQRSPSSSPVRRSMSVNAMTSTLLPDRVENFHRALDDEIVRQAFAVFCRRTLSSENVDFVRQVRELERLSWTEGATAKQLRDKLDNIATTFLAAESDSEVNVEGCSRVEVLCAIQAALEASRNHPVGVSGEGSWSWVLATAATKALVHLTQEIYPLIFDGLWPRFLASGEFKDMINTKEIRRTGFRDIDDRVILCPASQQRSNKRWTLKREPASFSWRGARELSEACLERPESSGRSSEDGMDTARTGPDVASTCRPPSKRRQCLSSLEEAEMPQGQEHQQQQQRREQQRGARVGRGGHIFGGLPRWSRGGGMKKGASLPSSTMTSPTPSTRGVIYSATQRAISWR